MLQYGLSHDPGSIAFFSTPSMYVALHASGAALNSPTNSMSRPLDAPELCLACQFSSYRCLSSCSDAAADGIKMHISFHPVVQETGYRSAPGSNHRLGFKADT